MLQSNLGNELYATRFKQAYNTLNPGDMPKYERILETQYTAAADGENIILIQALIGALRIAQITKEIKPMYLPDYSFNPNSGQINLLNDIYLSKDETLFILYAVLITS